VKYLDRAQTYIAEKIGQSSRTKLLVTLAAMGFVYGAAIPEADKAKWLVVSAGLFVLAQGFAEGLSRKYAPRD
jgi:hypothetical protein